MFKSITRLKRYILALGSNSFGLAIALLTQILFARLMGLENFGLWTLASSLVLLAITLFDAGVSAATPRFIAKSIGAEDALAARYLICQSAFFLLLYSIVLTLTFFYLTPLISGWFNMPSLKSPLVMMVLFIPFICLFQWATAVIKGLGHNPLQVFLMSPLLNTLIFLLGLAAWIKTQNVTTVMLGQGTAYAATGIVGLVYVVRFYQQLDKTASGTRIPFRDVIWHGLPLNLTATAQKILRRSDSIIIGAMLGASSVGAYRAAFTIASGIKQLMQPINSFALFYISRGVGREQTDDAIKHYDFSALLTLSLALPGYLICMSLPEEILHLLFGPEYSQPDAVMVLIILSAGFSIFVSMGPMGQLFNALGRNWVRFWLVVFISALNLGLNVLFISSIGLVGAAMATTTSFLTLFLLFNATIRDMPGGIRTRLSKTLILVLTTFYIAALVSHIKTDTLSVNIVITLCAAAFIFGLGCFFMHLESREKPTGTQAAK